MRNCHYSEEGDRRHRLCGHDYHNQTDQDDTAPPHSKGPVIEYETHGLEYQPKKDRQTRECTGRHEARAVDVERGIYHMVTRGCLDDAADIIVSA